MEHSPVIETGILPATRNLVHTYLMLGANTPGAKVQEETGMWLCTGTMEHPICNFAVDIEPSNEVAARIRELALQRKAFCVYLLPPFDGSEHFATLEKQGFLLSHRLKMLVADEVAEDRIELEEVQIPKDRRKLAEFMVDQFFHRLPTAFRRGIAEATAAPGTLKLYRAVWNERTAGAVMVSEHESVVGIYNLCVAPHFRNRGWGSSIVRTIVESASKRGCGVTLQCEASLASWYASLGFREVGSVSVFGLYRGKEIDIMS